MAEFADAKAGIDGLRIGDGLGEFAHGLDGDADDLAPMDVETAFVDEEAVHHGIEIGIVGDVIDVTIDVIVRPAGLEIQEMRITVTGFDRGVVHVGGALPEKILGAAVTRQPPCFKSPRTCQTRLNLNRE